MQLLDLTLDSPAANLALDEALLTAAEDGDNDEEILRFWESPRPLVVIGRASKIGVEVDVAACRQQGVPILRRASGGAAIVAGPGCLMYAVVLSVRRRPQLRMIAEAHRLVMGTMAAAIGPLVPQVRFDGTSDLTLDDQKFSGNSLRLKRDWALYHGTLLYDFPLETISQFLKTPPRQPAYRRGRDHRDFVTNLPTTADALRQSIAAAWQADQIAAHWPQATVERLVRERYTNAAWTGRW